MNWRQQAEGIGAGVTLSLIFIYILMGSSLGWNPTGWQTEIRAQQQIAHNAHVDECIRLVLPELNQ